MKLIDVQLGRVTQLHLADEVRPLKLPYYPDALRLVVERYGFVTHSLNEEAITKGAKFQHGRLAGERDTIPIVELAFFNDGIVVTARDTTAAEQILDDVIAWSTDTFGRRPPLTKRPKIFWSNVIVEFDHSVDAGLSILDRANALFRTALHETYGITYDTALTRLAFGNDPGKPVPEIKPDFILERRADFPVSSNRYFCAAPLKTEALLELLQVFDERKRRK